MSTTVSRQEWKDLRDVPLGPITGSGIGLGLCDVEPYHGQAVQIMQTEDHRAIALCDTCRKHVAVVQQQK